MAKQKTKKELLGLLKVRDSTIRELKHALEIIRSMSCKADAEQNRKIRFYITNTLAYDEEKTKRFG